MCELAAALTGEIAPISFGDLEFEGWAVLDASLAEFAAWYNNIRVARDRRDGQNGDYPARASRDALQLLKIRLATGKMTIFVL